ncbi:MAG: anion permease [Chitinispirillaceae bacterium]|nr:anion permease [Chitinispirillaceae bacterium]
MNNRWIGVVICSIAGILLAVFTPIQSLNPMGHKVLMALIMGLGLWIFQPGKMPFAVGACLLMAMLLLVGVSRNLVFAGFTSDSTWILIPATAFGYVLTKTGLGRRLAFLVIKTLKPTYLNLTVSWLIVGLILSAFTPSILIRIAIVMPIAAGCTSTLKLEPGSRGNTFLLLIAWTMAVIPGSGWLTGSLWGPVMMGMYSKVDGLKELCTPGLWMSAMMVPMLTMTGLIVGGIYWVFKPEPLDIEDSEAFVEEYSKLGSWSRSEMFSGIILAATFVMFVTEKIHGVGNVTACLLSFFLLFVVKVLEPDDIQKGVSWNLILFLGCILALPAIFSSPDIGISDWIKGTISPMISSFGGNQLFFILVAVVVMYLWRFFDIAWMIPSMALLVTMLPTVQTELGIHPLVTSCLIIFAGNFTFVTYMQPFSLMGSSLVKERSWTSQQLMQYGVVYLASTFITIFISFAYWKIVGLVK